MSFILFIFILLAFWFLNPYTLDIMFLHYVKSHMLLTGIYIANLNFKTSSGTFSRKGIAFDRIVGFQDLGAKDDFTTRALENVLKRKGSPCFLVSS